MKIDTSLAGVDVTVAVAIAVDTIGTGKGGLVVVSKVKVVVIGSEGSPVFRMTCINSRFVPRNKIIKRAMSDYFTSFVQNV